MFVNYRQRDAGGALLPHAQLVEALADRLGTHFGRDQVYLDTTLRPGTPYPDALRDRVADAAVLVVVLHAGWLADLADRAERRRDWVHEEIAIALQAGVRVVPLVLHDARLPTREELPDAIRGLADAQAVPLRFGSLAAGLRAAVAEIELVVAPDEPAPVAAVPPLPDRGRLVAVVGLLLLCGLLGTFTAVTGMLPFPELPAPQVAAVLAGIPVFFLLVLCAISGCRYALRRPMGWLDERLVRTQNRAFVLFGLGVVAVGLCLVALMAVAALGFTTDALLLSILVAVGVLMLMGLGWLRNQEHTPDWPRAPAQPTPIWVLKAYDELDRRLGSWTAPLPLSRRRDALLALGKIRGALATMSAPESTTPLAWWRTRNPWVTLTHAALVGVALALATTGVVLQWVAAGPDPTSTLLWSVAAAGTTGAYLGTLVFEYRYARWQVDTVAAGAEARLEPLERRLATLSEPGLIAAHHVNPHPDPH